MRCPRRALALACPLALFACSDPVASPPGDGGAGPSPVPEGDLGAWVFDGGGTADLAGCRRGTALATALTLTTLGTGAAGPAVLAESVAGRAVAWPGSDGKVHVTPLAADDTRAGADVLVTADRPHGLVVEAGGYALLVSRAPDFMTFLKVDAQGKVLAIRDLVGGGDHATVGVEWFGEFARTGRLAATASGYAAYFALHRRWPDNVGHQGDTLRLLGPDGSPQSGGWDWGCSHSLDQRIAVKGTEVGAICVSDCYPSKAVHYNHRGGIISNEPSGNCMGGSNAELGGVMPASSGGFWVAYASREGRASRDLLLARVTTGGQVAARTVVAQGTGDEGDGHLAAFDGALLAGYEVGGQRYLQRLDASGQPTGAPEPIAARLDPDTDFVGLADGDVAWPVVDGGKLAVARVRACVP